MSYKSSKSKKKGGKMASGGSSKKQKAYQYYGYPYYPSKSGMSRTLKKKKSHKEYYPSQAFWYSTRGKGKGYYLFDRQDDDHPQAEDDDDDDLPFCPPPRPKPPRPKPHRPTPPSSRKSAHPPAWSPTAKNNDDGDSVTIDYHPAPSPHLTPTRAPNGTPTTASGGSPVHQSQENPAPSNGNEPSARAPDANEPIVASWGDEDDSAGGLSDQSVRAALFAGAGVAAGLIAVIATYIYKREKKYVSKEMLLQQQSRGRLGARPRQPSLPLAKTMSATVATETELAALARP